MKSNRFWTAAVVLFGLTSALTAQQPGSTASPREQLQQYVTQLQASPSDDALRTKVIQLALTLDPKPAVPADAAINAAKGKTIFGSASSLDDMKAAAAAFAQASQLAPWVPDYYYNEGLALEKAKQYDDAIHALNFYLLAALNAPDAADVRGKIEGIKYEEDGSAKKAQLEADQRAQSAAEQQQQFVSQLIGMWKWEDTGFTFSLTVDGRGAFNLTYSRGSNYLDGFQFVGQVTGNSVSGTWRSSMNVPAELARFCHEGRRLDENGIFTGSFSADGQTLIVDSTGEVHQLNCAVVYKTVRNVFKKE